MSGAAGEHLQASWGQSLGISICRDERRRGPVAALHCLLSNGKRHFPSKQKAKHVSSDGAVVIRVSGGDLLPSSIGGLAAHSHRQDTEACWSGSCKRW